MIRLATSCTVPDTVFGRLEDLAAHVAEWSGGRPLLLRTVTVSRPTGVDRGVAIYAMDLDGERGDHLGYAIMEGDPRVAMDKLWSMLGTRERAA